MPASLYPDFYILGAQKSGTTSLCALLEQHPQLCLSRPKEPMILSRDDIALRAPATSRGRAAGGWRLGARGRGVPGPQDGPQVGPAARGDAQPQAATHTMRWRGWGILFSNIYFIISNDLTKSSELLVMQRSVRPNHDLFHN